MEQKKHTAGVQIRGIEILNSSINLPNLPAIALSNFIFSIDLESKIDATAKLIFVVVTVEIGAEEYDPILGSLAVSCIYSISKFDDVIKMNAEGKLEIPPPLAELLNAASVSTARGVMFSTFKGTFLHNAFLPMIEPHQFQVH
jgi:hypothetical protein